MGASNDVSLISPSADEEVAAFFDACPTSFAQQTIGWRNVIAPIGPDAPLFLGCRHDGRLVGVLPAYKYEGSLGSILTTCPQAGAMGGVACRPNEDAPAIYQALLGAFVELAKKMGARQRRSSPTPSGRTTSFTSASLRPTSHFRIVARCSTWRRA